MTCLPFFSFSWSCLHQPQLRVYRVPHGCAFHQIHIDHGYLSWHKLWQQDGLGIPFHGEEKRLRRIERGWNRGTVEDDML